MELDYFETNDIGILDRLSESMAMHCQPIDSRVRIIVTIPAKNEERQIFSCLESLAAQKDIYGEIVDSSLFEVIVLCHDCDDRTEEECRRFSTEYPHINISTITGKNPHINNVGAVRRILMNIAYTRIPVPFGFIAMTDADSRAHPKWIANLLGYIRSPYGLICGKIIVDSRGSSIRVQRALNLKGEYWRYRMELEDSIVPIPWDPSPKHSDNAGPNMAVRADIYREIGGIEPIGFCEDVAFYDTIIWYNIKVRHCPLTLVTTSARTKARAPWGFGAELSTWRDPEAAVFNVEGLEAVLARYRITKLIKEYYNGFDTEKLNSICRLTGIGESQIQMFIRDHSSWKSLGHRMEKHLDNCPRWRSRFPMVPIAEACKLLKDYVAVAISPLPQT